MALVGGGMGRPLLGATRLTTTGRGLLVLKSTRPKSGYDHPRYKKHKPMNSTSFFSVKWKRVLIQEGSREASPTEALESRSREGSSVEKA